MGDRATQRAVNGCAASLVSSVNACWKVAWRARPPSSSPWYHSCSVFEAQTPATGCREGPAIRCTPCDTRPPRPLLPTTGQDMVDCMAQ